MALVMNVWKMFYIKNEILCIINVPILSTVRLCIVEGRGQYKRGAKYCPVLDEENSKIECVLGTDR